MSIQAKPVSTAVLAVLVLSAAMAATPQRARGETVTGSFERVRALSGLVPGDYVVTGSKANSDDRYAMLAGLGGSSPTFLQRHGDTPLEVEADAIADPDEAIVWTLEAASAGGGGGDALWTLRNGDDYVAYKGSANSATFTNAAVSNALWTVAESGTEGLFTVANAAKPARVLQYNTTANQERFACYTNFSRTQPLAFWRKTAPGGSGGGAFRFDGGSEGTVGGEVAFTAAPAAEGAQLSLAGFRPPQGSTLTMDDLGIDLPRITFVPDVPGSYVFVFAASSATAEASGEWTVTVLPADGAELRITSIAVAGGTITLGYEGEAGAVQGTDDLTGAEDSWKTVPGASIDAENRKATLAAGKHFLRLSAAGSGEEVTAGVQLWVGGPFWAKTNIGAESPEHSGLYFWWGDTAGYWRDNDVWVASDGTSMNFSFDEGEVQTYGLDQDDLSAQGWITADGVLVPEHDPAQVRWGGDWWMPADWELQVLLDNCDWTWTSVNGVKGWEVRGRGGFADASIFLPAAGYGTGTGLEGVGSNGCLWSSVPDAVDGNHSLDLSFGSGSRDRGSDDRYLGYSVRPVRRPPSPHAGVQLWEGGPEWAETNIGAEAPEDSGLYFWWGDTVGCRRENDAWVASDGSSTDYAFNDGNTPTAGLDSDALWDGGWISGGTYELSPSCDAAQVQWGWGWRMPSAGEIQALADNCDWTRTTLNDVNVAQVRGRGDFANACIYLPLAGFGYDNLIGYEREVGWIWSSSLSLDEPEEIPISWSLSFAGTGAKSFANRSRGFPIRPVRTPK